MKKFYIHSLQRIVDQIIGGLGQQGVTDRELYLAKFDPEDNDHVAAMGDVVVTPVMDMLREFKFVSFDYFPEGYMLAGKDAKYLDQPMQEMAVKIFGIPREALERIHEITNDTEVDIFTCRDRLFAYLSSLHD